MVNGYGTVDRILQGNVVATRETESLQQKGGDASNRSPGATTGVRLKTLELSRTNSNAWKEDAG
jgi:hypothetical protein